MVTAVLEVRSWATRSVDTSAAPRTTVGLTEAAPPRAEFHAAGVVPSVGAGLGAVPGTTVVRGPMTTRESAGPVGAASMVIRGVSEAVSRSDSAVAFWPLVVRAVARPWPRTALVSLEAAALR